MINAIEIIDRAILMLTVSGNHCQEYAPADLSVYDGTECDGLCINDDCITSIEELENLKYALKGATP